MQRKEISDDVEEHHKTSGDLSSEEFRFLRKIRCESATSPGDGLIWKRLSMHVVVRNQPTLCSTTVLKSEVTDVAVNGCSLECSELSLANETHMPVNSTTQYVSLSTTLAVFAE